MSVSVFSRCGLTLFLLAVVSGCSSIDLSEPSTTTNACRKNPSSCMYEGSYEPGERDYAEREARRLNQASLEKLRRQSVR